MVFAPEARPIDVRVHDHTARAVGVANQAAGAARRREARPRLSIVAPEGRTKAEGNANPTRRGELAVIRDPPAEIAPRQDAPLQRAVTNYNTSVSRTTVPRPRAYGPQELQKSIETMSPTTPTSIRMTPTTSRLMPSASRSRAKVRTAPT